ncbi:MAG TPA: cupredoxin domain-containing protein [Rhizomicrobium sp.]|jgi:plastocyanin
MLSRLYRHAFAAGTLAFACAITPASAADAQVTIKNFDFSPMMVSVPVGGTVVWKNLDGEPHTVVSVDGQFRSTALDQDETFSFKFTKPGTYKYLCSIHPKMVAMIMVK